MFVSRHMTRDPVTIGPETKIIEARSILSNHDFRHLPVVTEDKRLLGMVTDRDIRSAFPSSLTVEPVRSRMMEELEEAKVGSIMSTALISLTPSATLDDALMLLEANRVGALPVTTRDGIIKGIFSIRDLMRAYRDLFGLGEKGSSLVVIKDSGEPEIMLRIVEVMARNDIPVTRIVKTNPMDEDSGRVYVRIHTYNLRAVRLALEKVGLECLLPE